MARDYRAADVFSSGTRPLPLWLWLFAALAISGFVGLIYYLDQYEKSKAGAHNTGVESSESASSKENKDQEEETHFDFYKLLPNISVDVPKGNTREREQSTASEHATKKPAPAFNYILQVGSFKDFHEADRLKARLAFLGIEVKIEKVTLNQGDTWNRVRIGPLQSEREMNKIRSQLRNQQIEPIVLKVKG